MVCNQEKQRSCDGGGWVWMKRMPTRNRERRAPGGRGKGLGDGVENGDAHPGEGFHWTFE
jgi:hypothetical protein